MKRLLTAVISMSAVLSMMPFASVHAQGNTVRILFTDDLHDQLESTRSYDDENELNWFGGYASLKTAVDSYRTEDTVLVDAGDFSTGSLYNYLYKTEATGLTLMNAMGYDAIALGEGEFLYGAEALGTMINVPEETPALLCANLEKPAGAFKAAWEQKGSGTAVIERNGTKIGVFSVLNPDHTAGKQTSYTLTDPAEAAKTAVEELKSQGADVILCLSHYCTDADPKADERLAEQVDGIDVIVSGHTYNEIKKPVTVNDTIIVASGTNGKYLGVLDIADGKTVKYELVPITSEFAPDEEIKASISAYAKLLNSGVLSGSKYTTSSAIARAGYSFDDCNAEDAEFGKSNTADLIADAYIEYFKENLAARKKEQAQTVVVEEPEETEEETEEEHVSTFSKQGILNLLNDAKESWIEVLNGGLENRDPVVSERPIALIGKTELKNTFYEGSITVSDIYRVIPTGTQGTEFAEANLVAAYLTGSDLRRLCELDLAVGRDNPEAQFYFGDLEYDYNDNRMDFNKVTEVRYRATTDYFVPVSRNTYYPVVMSLDLAKKLPSLFKLAGAESVTLYNMKGSKASSANLLVLTEDHEPAVQWKVVAKFVDDFGREGTVGHVETEYRTSVTEKFDVTSWELKSLVKNTSVSAWKVYGDYLLKGLGALVVLGIINAVFRRISLKKNSD